jgi:Protein of unknown function (DUF2946)
MKRLRQLVRLRSRGGILAVLLAYLLAIEAMLASVGLGMSPGADHAGLVVCSLGSNQTANMPARDGDRQKPNPEPQCPLCFIAAQSAGHVAIAGEGLAFPAYFGLLIAAISDPLGDAAFVTWFRHRHGEPRAPPVFSV